MADRIVLQGRLSPRLPRGPRLREARRPALRRRRHADLDLERGRAHRRPGRHGQLRGGRRRRGGAHHRAFLRPHRAARRGDRRRRARRPDLVDVVEVVVHKPEAPSASPSPTCEVRLDRGNVAAVVIALGSNLGDRGETLARRRRPCARSRPHRHRRVVDRRDRPGRWAGAAALPQRRGGRPVDPRLRRCSASCTASRPPGRTREVQWGAQDSRPRPHPVRHPRLSQEVVSDDDRLTLPHPRAAERAFVLLPWARADPQGHVAGWGRGRAASGRLVNCLTLSRLDARASGPAPNGSKSEAAHRHPCVDARPLGRHRPRPGMARDALVSRAARERAPDPVGWRCGRDALPRGEHPRCGMADAQVQGRGPRRDHVPSRGPRARSC